MPTYILIIMLLVAYSVAFFSVPAAIKLAHKIGAIDKPDQRKVHARSMPRLGGLSIFLAFIVTMALFLDVSGPYAGIIYGAVIIFAAGLLDDIYSLSPWFKLGSQILAATVAIYFGVLVNFVTNPFDGQLNLGFLAIPLTLLWIVGISNAVNLIDGLDGLAAGVSAIAATTLGIVALIQGETVAAMAAFILVAALLGFLPYNFYPARTFMGDCGSNFLGFTLACLAIMALAKGAAVVSLFVPIVILGIPIFDTFFAIIRRIQNKTPIFKPDRGHLHHRLMALGNSHRKSVIIIYGISAFFALIAVALSFTQSPKANLFLILLIFLIIYGADKIGLRTGRSRVGYRQKETTHPPG